MCTSFTHDGRFLITGDSDGLVKVWADTNKNLELQTHFYAGEHSLSAVSTAPCSKTLAVGDFAGNVVICNISGKVLSRFDAHVGRVSAITHTPDGNFLITAGADSTIKLWSISKRTCRVFKGHNGSVEGITLGQGGSLISWGSDFTLRIWTLDCQFHRVLKDYPSESVALAHFTNDGNEIRVIGDQGDIHIINLNLNNLVSQATAWCSGTN